MSFDVVREGAVALLELDHGKANEMGSEQLRSFEGLLDELDGVRALVTYSRRRSRRGTPIFIAGANVTERGGWTQDDVKAHVRWQRAVLARLRRAPIFHVAVVNGVALGWGTEFLLTCDYRIAAQEAVFGLPETGLGILPGAGGTAELATYVGLGQALRLGMTGERIGADEAARIGLVEEVVADVDAGLDRARALAAMVAKKSPTAVATFKAACIGAIGLPAAERTELEARAYEHCLASGEAAVGRENFGAIRKGEDVPWGPLKTFE